MRFSFINTTLLVLLFATLTPKHAESKTVYFPNLCIHALEAIENPLFEFSNPLSSIKNYIQKKQTSKSLKKFDWDYYRTKKLEYRGHFSESRPELPEGIFESNVAWFEAFLERDGGEIFSFEESMHSLPEVKKNKLIKFFKKAPFSKKITKKEIFDEVYSFFEIIDHDPLLTEYFYAEDAIEIKNELRSKAIVTQLTMDGLNHVFEKMGYLSPKRWKEKVNDFFNTPALMVTKLALFNASVFSGVPYVYLPELKNIRLSANEIDEVLLNGNIESLVNSKIGKRIEKKSIRRLIYQNIRKRVVELNAVAMFFLIVNEGGAFVEKSIAQRAVQIEQQKVQEKILNDQLNEVDHELDDLINQFSKDKNNK